MTSIEKDFPIVAGSQAVENPQERGLAATARSHQRDEFRWLNLKGNIVENLDRFFGSLATETLAQVLYDKFRGGSLRHRTSPCRGPLTPLYNNNTFSQGDVALNLDAVFFPPLEAGRVQAYDS
jgi:hypothetical protein